MGKQCIAKIQILSYYSAITFMLIWLHRQLQNICTDVLEQSVCSRMSITAYYITKIFDQRTLIFLSKFGSDCGMIMIMVKMMLPKIMKKKLRQNKHLLNFWKEYKQIKT